MIRTIADARRVIKQAGGTLKLWSPGFYQINLPEYRDPYSYSPKFVSRDTAICMAEAIAQES